MFIKKYYKKVFEVIFFNKNGIELNHKRLDYITNYALIIHRNVYTTLVTVFNMHGFP